ncbi:hypothetical protein C2E23DRAFT_889253 [Lenzites betulinus]|nr:hypothetical protein C2E23DRAFT_889253 [Lenzites betulinus]
MPGELENTGLMQDSDESDYVPSDLDALERTDDKAESVADDNENAKDAEADDDAVSPVEDSDTEDLLPPDAVVPTGLMSSTDPSQSKGKRRRDEDSKRAAHTPHLCKLPWSKVETRVFTS